MVFRLALAASLLVVAPHAAGRPSAPSPRTLVSMSGRIGAFAQDGPRIAWLLTTGACGRRVKVRDLATRRQTVLTSRNGATCRAGHRGAARLALAGRRAVWTLSAGENHVHVVTAAVGDRKDVELDRVALAGLVLLTGDGQTLVYTTGGPLFQVVGARARRVPRSLWAYALSSSGGRVAALRAAGPICACNWSPTWSPDGRTIAYASGRDSLHEIYAASLDGGEARLTWDPLSDPYAALAPDWSTRDRIAFQGWDANDVPVLFAMNADGRGAGPLPGPLTGVEPAWSPDGTELAFARLGPDTPDYGISIAPAGGGPAVALTRAQDRVDGDPDWSPDGTKIVFDRSPGTIEIVNRDGTGLHALWPGTNPAWSPDGTEIAYDDGDYLSYVSNADGSGTARWIGTGSDPAWSPDGKRIALVAEAAGVHQEIFVVNADGSGRRQLTHTVKAPVVVRAEILELPDAGLVRAHELPQPGPQGVALSEAVLALLYRGRIELRDPTSGALRATVSVPLSAADISISGTRVVFRTRRSIWLVDAQTSKRSRIAGAAARPVGLSIEGRRVAWAENRGGRARIRAVTPP